MEQGAHQLYAGLTKPAATPLVAGRRKKIKGTPASGLLGKFMVRVCRLLHIQSETERATIQTRNWAGKSSRRNPSSNSLGSLLSGLRTLRRSWECRIASRFRALLVLYDI
jgi:hypothetical protein